MPILKYGLALALLAVGPVFPQQSPAVKTVPAENLELDAFGGGSFFNNLANGGTAGGRASYGLTRRFSLEGGYNFMVNNGRFGNQIHSIALNPLFHFAPPGSRLRPYITAGAGPIWFVPTQRAIAQAKLQGLSLATSSDVALNYGGGMKLHLSPRLGLRFDARGLYTTNDVAHNALETTVGLAFFFGQSPVLKPAPEPPPKPTLQPLNPGEISGANGALCQGRPLTLHATATDPAGRLLSYKWKANGAPAGGNNPDFSYTPNNAGDFQFEVEIADSNDPTRVVRAGPRTLVVQDYVPPQILGITASPNSITLGDTNAPHIVRLAADVGPAKCGGNLNYKWSLSEGSLNGGDTPTAVFDAASLSFDAGGGQTKSITATLVATDETGKSASQSIAFQVDDPPQYKRLGDIIFAKNGARVNNCGKRILIDQAAPQAGAAFDVVMVGHRAADEQEYTGVRGRRLDEQRALAAAAVLTGNHGVCANLDASQVRIALADVSQQSAFDPALCGTSNTPRLPERAGFSTSGFDKERRVEVYLVPKDSRLLPPAARGAKPVSARVLKVLGCPR